MLGAQLLERLQETELKGTSCQVPGFPTGPLFPAENACSSIEATEPDRVQAVHRVR